MKTIQFHPCLTRSHRNTQAMPLLSLQGYPTLHHGGFCTTWSLVQKVYCFRQHREWSLHVRSRNESLFVCAASALKNHCLKSWILRWESENFALVQTNRRRDGHLLQNYPGPLFMVTCETLKKTVREEILASRRINHDGATKERLKQERWEIHRMGKLANNF